MRSIIYDDLYRYEGRTSLALLVRYVFFTPGFRYVYLFRKTQNASTIVTRFFWHVLLRRCMLATGIQIPYQTSISNGFRIVHFGNIVINPGTIIGRNFNIAQGASIGNAEGRMKGTPIIGNNVCVQPNAVVVGGITIGNDVFIAPNAFVNVDVPDGALVLGNPCRIIPKEKASAPYIVFKLD